MSVLEQLPSIFYHSSESITCRRLYWNLNIYYRRLLWLIPAYKCQYAYSESWILWTCWSPSLPLSFLCYFIYSKLLFYSTNRNLIISNLILQKFLGFLCLRIARKIGILHVGLIFKSPLLVNRRRTFLFGSCRLQFNRKAMLSETDIMEKYNLMKAKN